MKCTEISLFRVMKQNSHECNLKSSLIVTPVWSYHCFISSLYTQPKHPWHPVGLNRRARVLIIEADLTKPDNPQKPWTIKAMCCKTLNLDPEIKTFKNNCSLWKQFFLVPKQATCVLTRHNIVHISAYSLFISGQ